MGWIDTLKDIGGKFLKDNAGDIAAGVAGAVLGSGSNKGSGSQTTSITSVPAWMSDYAQQLLAQANMLASQPYQAYGGPRVAGLTQDQQDAANMIRGNVGQAAGVVQNVMGNIDPNAGRGMLAQAGNYLNNAGGNWLNNSGEWMADYQDKVTNPAVDQALRVWNQQINPGIQSDFAGAKGVGAFGSDAMLRHTLGASNQLTQQLGENMASYLDKGYSQGMNQFNAQNQQAGQLAQIAAQLGGQEQQMGHADAGLLSQLAQQWNTLNMGDAAALDSIGGQQQQLNQQAMDIDYSNWLEAQGYGKDQIAFMQSVLQGNAPFADQTTTDNKSSTTYTSPLQAATQAYALWNAIKTGTQPKMDPNSAPQGP